MPVELTDVISGAVGRQRRWAWSFPGVQERFVTMTNPPVITRGGNTSSVNSSYVNGNTQINAASPIFRHIGSIFADATESSFPIKKPSHITASDGSKGSGQAPIRVRFLTDAPVFDICFVDRGFSQFNIIVDGEIAVRDKAVAFTNTGNMRYTKVDFGANTTTYEKAQTPFSISSGGTGYVVGDTVVLNGGSGAAAGTPTTIVVTQVSSGAVTNVDIVTPGNYSSQPTGTFSQASTSGTGTGLQVQALFFGKKYSSRKLRRVELVYQSPASFIGVVGTTTDMFLPWVDDTEHKPSLCVIGDSIQIGTYLRYAGAHIGASIAQSIGLWDNLVINGIGGTGWITGGETAWSSPSRVADFIAHQADFYLIIGSQNDGAASTTLENAVTSVINQLHEAVPHCKIVGIGNVMGGSTSLSASIGAGYGAAADQSRVRYLDNQAPYPWMSTTVDDNWFVTNDGNHLSQEGQDLFAKIAAPYVANAILEMAE